MPKRHRLYLKQEEVHKIKKAGCRYCNILKNLTIDHKHPVKMGGTNKLKNLHCLCKGCNTLKSGLPHKELVRIILWYENFVRDSDSSLDRKIKKFIKNGILPKMLRSIAEGKTKVSHQATSLSSSSAEGF